MPEGSESGDQTDPRSREFAKARLKPVDFEDLPGFAEDDALASWQVFQVSCERLIRQDAPLRAAVAPGKALMNWFTSVAHLSPPSCTDDALRLWKTVARPHRTSDPVHENAPGFLTGYYEPVVDGSLVRKSEFTEPVRSRPRDLVSVNDFPQTEISGFRRSPDGSLTPYPTRAEIDAGAIDGQSEPIIWLRDAIEVFILQVQGSGRVRLADGTTKRLIYAGRNGRPYTSIGQILIREGAIQPRDMSLQSLKHWVRQNGQDLGQGGRNLLHRNESYVFYDWNDELPDSDGPVGGQGVSLTQLRSIAVDRTIWPYGLPFWLDAEIPWRDEKPSSFRRLMIGQDTGTAIVGPARFDIYFGSGDAAGEAAARIRHPCDAFVLLPAKRSFS